MVQNIFQQRYFSDKGWIIVAQEGLEPAAGEAVYLEDGQPAPDGKYEFDTARLKQYVEVREGLVHYYYKRAVETDIGTGTTFLMILVFAILLVLAFHLFGRH